MFLNPTWVFTCGNFGRAASRTESHRVGFLLV